MLHANISLEQKFAQKTAARTPEYDWADKVVA